MMNLTHTLTVEHADSQCEGCLWHKDPDCLCDVVVSAPMGDDYETPLFMEEAYLDGDGDEWLHEAFDQMVGRTALKSFVCEPYRALLAVETKPELVIDLLDGMTAKAAGDKHGVWHGVTQDLRRLLNLRELGNHGKNKRTRQVRAQVLDRHFNGGERVIDIFKDLQSLGVAQQTMYQWVQRVRTGQAAA